MEQPPDNSLTAAVTRVAVAAEGILAILQAGASPEALAKIKSVTQQLQQSGDALATAVAAQTKTGEKIMAGTPNALDTTIAALTAQVTANTTVEGSAVTLINGIAAQIAAAVAAAQAAGATPTELSEPTTLQTNLTASAAALSAAITANTPATP